MGEPSARKLLRCNRCDSIIDNEDYFSSLGSEPLILCSKCHSKVKDAWPQMCIDPNARKTFVIETLCEKPADRIYMSSVPNYKDTLKCLEREGYRICLESDGYYHLKDSLELAGFAESLSSCSTSEDAKWIRKKYSRHWQWLCKAYSENRGIPCTEDCEELIRSSCRISDENDESPDELSGFRSDMHERVFLRLLDLMMEECDGISVSGPGMIEFKGRELSYGLIAQESMIGDISGFDCDIFVSEDSIECFVDDDVIPFLDYFELRGNKKAEDISGYMCGLCRRGL